MTPRYIARFELHDLLHTGESFTVHRAQHRQLPSLQVAVKQLHPVLATQPTQRQRLQQQGERLAQLRHPHIAGVLDFVDEGPHCALVLSMPSGRALSDILRDGGPPWSSDRVTAVLKQWLETVGFAHAHGHIHGQLTPGHVFIDTLDRVTLSGFGSNTHARSTVADDLNAIGHLITALLFKKPLSATPSRQSLLDAGLSPPLASVVRGLTHQHPHERLPSCGAALAVLAQDLHGSAATETLHLGDRIIELGHHVVHTPNGPESLTGHDVALLAYFIQHPSQVLQRERLLRDVWDNHGHLVTRAVDLAVGRLRKKIEPDPSTPRYLLTVHGRGYRFEPSANDAPRPLAAPTPEPPAHHLLGRANTLTEIVQGIRDGATLTTLLGPGGVGKTALAQAVATHCINEESFNHVWFCDVHTATHMGRLVALIAETIDIPIRTQPEDEVHRVGELLAPMGPCVFVLDNLEQLADVAQEALTHWLQQAPNVRFLVTSQTRLGLHTERVVPVEPLNEQEGVALFIEAARRVDASFSVSDPQHPAILDIVRAVDGLPLAIELAAARVRLLSPQQIANRLSQRFAILASKETGRPSRHMTLHNAIDWSWQLLSAEEQQLMAQASVFRGGFTPEAAEAVLVVDEHTWVLDALQNLVDKSLLRTTRDGESVRFDFFQSIHAFVHQKEAPGEAISRHRDYYLALAARLNEASEGPTGAEATNALQRELENLLHIARNGDGETTAHVALLLDTHLQERASHSTHIALIEAALPHSDRLSADQAMRLHCALARLKRANSPSSQESNDALGTVSHIASNSGEASLIARATLYEIEVRTLPEGNLQRAQERLQVIQADVFAHGTLPDRFAFHHLQSRIAEHQARWAEAEHHARHALTIAQSQQKTRWEAKCLQFLGLALCNSGQSNEAVDVLRRAIQMHNQFDARQSAASCMGILAEVLLFTGRHDECESLLKESYELSIGMGNPVGAAAAQGARGRVALDRDDLGAAETLFNESIQGLANWPIGAHINRVYLAMVHLLQDNPHGAAKVLEDTHTLLTTDTHRQGRIKALYVHAITQHRLGQHKAALQAHQEAWALAAQEAPTPQAMAKLCGEIIGHPLDDISPDLNQLAQQSMELRIFIRLHAQR